MAIIHQATLSPSKLEMLGEYLPTIESLAGLVGSDLSQIGSYRFDDPAGEVGIETHILTSSTGAVLQIPLTYRNGPLEGAEAWLLGSMQHSVLGTRWVYDACGDAVYVGELVRVIVTGGSQVALMVETADGPVEREPTVTVRGTGSGAVPEPSITQVVPEGVGTNTRIAARGHVVVVRHALDEVWTDSGSIALRGTWAALTKPVTLAFLA